MRARISGGALLRNDVLLGVDRVLLSGHDDAEHLGNRLFGFDIGRDQRDERQHDERGNAQRHRHGGAARPPVGAVTDKFWRRIGEHRGH